MAFSQVSFLTLYHVMFGISFKLFPMQLNGGKYLASKIKQLLTPYEWLRCLQCDALVQKARVILFTVWHQIYGSPKITLADNFLKKKKKKAHSDTFLSHGTVERAVLFKVLLRAVAVGSTAFTRKLLLTRLTLAHVHWRGHLGPHNMPAPLSSCTTSRIIW